MDFIKRIFDGSITNPLKIFASSITNPSKTLMCNLIDKNGTLNVVGMEEFEKELMSAECGRPYIIVSIIGPQSSGKSTLLNNIYGTDFKEMNASEGRSQTTQGIWIAPSCDGTEPLTLVMDLEGADSADREDDTAFEKQSALFALAVSDVVLINMWCNDIGREHASCKPLLKTVFSQVTKRLSATRKITLIIVIRDKAKETPFRKLELQLKNDIQKIWESVPKGGAQKDILLSQVFHVVVFALSSYEHQKDKFKKEVKSLRHQIKKSIAHDRGLAATHEDILPASLSCKIQPTWKLITENKDLALPPQKVIVANFRCQQIAEEKFRDFTKNQDWLELKELQYPGSEFGKKLSPIIERCLSEFDAEVADYVVDVKTDWRKNLKDKLFKLVQTTVGSVLRHLHSTSIEDFKKSFNKSLQQKEEIFAAFKRCKDNCLKQFKEGYADVIIEQGNEEEISTTRIAKLLRDLYEVLLNEALEVPVEERLEIANENTWRSIRELFQKVTQKAIIGLTNDLSHLNVDEPSRDKLLAMLENCAKSVVEDQVLKKAKSISKLMNDKFKRLFYRDENYVPNYWFKKEDVISDKEAAYSGCFKLLCVMAAIQLDDKYDNLEQEVLLVLEGQHFKVNEKDSWNKIPASKTVITPSECILLWKKFEKETAPLIEGADVRHAKHNREKCIRRLKAVKEAMQEVLHVATSISNLAGIVYGIAQYFN